MKLASLAVMTNVSAKTNSMPIGDRFKRQRKGCALGFRENKREKKKERKEERMKKERKKESKKESKKERRHLSLRIGSF